VLSTLTPGAGSPYTGVPDETGCSTANFTAVGNNATYDYSATPTTTTPPRRIGRLLGTTRPCRSRATIARRTRPRSPTRTALGALNYLEPSKLVNATWFYQCGSHAFPGTAAGTSSTVWRTQVAPGPTTQTPSAGAKHVQRARAGQIGAGRPNVGHAIIMLSDGDAPPVSTGPFGLDTRDEELPAGLQRRRDGRGKGIEFFTVAYGAVTSGCATDTSVDRQCLRSTANPGTEVKGGLHGHSPLCAMS